MKNGILSAFLVVFEGFLGGIYLKDGLVTFDYRFHESNIAFNTIANAGVSCKKTQWLFKWKAT